MAAKKPNILLIAVDSLRRDRMSLYGYHRNTTPHIDEFAQDCTVFTNTYSAHIPTTSAYASMLTGGDCFTTEVVALRHKNGLTTKVKTLAEVCKENGYETTCVGFTGNPSSRGFDNYIDYKAWGNWNDDRFLPKAQNLNEVTQPEIHRLSKKDKPWFMMLRHMDPHSPYLPPHPFERMFYGGDETDKSNKSLQRCYDFKPFADYFRSWFPPGCTDVEYVKAMYDGSIAYMDSCLQTLFTQLEDMGILDDTIVVLNGDHGETLDEHEYWFDHHGLHEPNLIVPLMIRYPKKLPMGAVVTGYNQHKDLMPTLVELAGLKVDAATKKQFDGKSLTQMLDGKADSFESEFYITECTWMRKHGWRTPQWKLIRALEPDFHFDPEVQLFNLIEDPQELENVADRFPDIVEHLTCRMNAFIAKREKARGITNPMLTQGEWAPGAPFKSSEAAFNGLHIGDPKAASKLQAKDKKK
jgi:arylsulfatase A-like enzyme